MLRTIAIPKFKNPRIIYLSLAGIAACVLMLVHPSDPIIDNASFLFASGVIGVMLTTAAQAVKIGARNVGTVLAVEALVLLVAIVYQPTVHMETEVVETVIDPIFGVVSMTIGGLSTVFMGLLEQGKAE